MFSQTFVFLCPGKQIELKSTTFVKLQLESDPNSCKRDKSISRLRRSPLAILDRLGGKSTEGPSKGPHRLDAIRQRDANF
jgi:hypothetical protein